jgi:hypothetical protein
MSALILVVGKNLCVSHVETALTSLKLEHYMCVDGPDMADWLMRDGYGCEILIVDKHVFTSPEAAEDWLASNPQAVPILTDKFQTRSDDFLAQVKAAVGLSRHLQTHPALLGVH